MKTKKESKQISREKMHPAAVLFQKNIIQSILKFSDMKNIQNFQNFRLISKYWKFVVEKFKIDEYLKTNEIFEPFFCSEKNIPIIFEKFIQIFKKFSLDLNMEALSIWPKLNVLILKNVKKLNSVTFTYYPNIELPPDFENFKLTLYKNSQN